MNRDTLIELRNVAIGYKNKAILDGIDLALGRGEFWGVLGPNGGGKTTLLRTILGLLPSQGGRLSVPEDVVFGYVPQNEGFDSLVPLSVSEIVSMGRYSRVPPGKRLGANDVRKVRECMESLGIAHLSDRPLRSLSGGEKQRSLIARAIAAEPHVLVLDEPAASLDIRGERSVMKLVKELGDGRDLTVLMVSHFIDALAKFADHAMLIARDSGLFFTGTSGEVLSSKHLREVLGVSV